MTHLGVQLAASSWLVKAQKCVTDYIDGAMCAAEAPRGPGLVARMEETSHAAGCCREPPSAPPARAEEPNLDSGQKSINRWRRRRERRGGSYDGKRRTKSGYSTRKERGIEMRCERRS